MKFKKKIINAQQKGLNRISFLKFFNRKISDFYLEKIRKPKIFVNPLLGIVTVQKKESRVLKKVEKILEKNERKKLERFVGKSKVAFEVSKKVADPLNKMLLQTIGEAKTKEEKESVRNALRRSASKKDFKTLEKLAVRGYKRTKNKEYLKRFLELRGYSPYTQKEIERMSKSYLEKIEGTNKNMRNRTVYLEICLDESCFGDAIRKTLNQIGITNKEKRNLLKKNVLEMMERAHQKANLAPQNITAYGQPVSDPLVANNDKKISNILKSERNSLYNNKSFYEKFNQNYLTAKQQVTANLERGYEPKKTLFELIKILKG